MMSNPEPYRLLMMELLVNIRNAIRTGQARVQRPLDTVALQSIKHVSHSPLHIRYVDQAVKVASVLIPEVTEQNDRITARSIRDEQAVAKGLSSISSPDTEEESF